MCVCLCTQVYMCACLGVGVCVYVCATCGCILYQLGTKIIQKRSTLFETNTESLVALHWSITGSYTQVTDL